jgi:hypothetical protein
MIRGKDGGGGDKVSNDERFNNGKKEAESRRSRVMQKVIA